MSIKMKVINYAGPRPLAYATPKSVGLDLYALTSRDKIELPPGGRWLFSTGVRIALPSDHVALVLPKSGLGWNFGLVPVTGVIDEDYRGEIKVNLMNLDRLERVVMPGDKIANLVVMPITRVEIELVTELDETSRGEGGFGSTGR